MILKDVLKKQGLTEEQIVAILKACDAGDNPEVVTAEVKQKVQNLEEELKTATTTIAELKKSNGDNEALQEKVIEYEDQIKTQKAENETKFKNLAIDGAIEIFLKENKAKYPDLLAGKFDREKVKIDEKGKVTNIGELGKGIMESYKEMFSEPIAGFTPPSPDTARTNDSYKNLISNADNMSAEEVAAQFSSIKFE
ncbi:MAG: phage scaffolding protein [Eubacterium sp.]